MENDSTQNYHYDPSNLPVKPFGLSDGQGHAGDALTGLLDPSVDPKALEAQRERLGLNNPWYVQYWDWIKNAVQGDFGQSFRFKMPVTDLIGQRVANTFWLALATLVLTYFIAIPLGIISGRYNDTWSDRLITGYTYLGFAAPLFILLW